MTSTTRRPGSRAARLTSVAVPTIGLALSAVMVWQASYSAFSATTENPGNTWSSGSLTLGDSDSGMALFTAENLVPGSTETQCIRVTSTASAPSSVELYGAGLTDSKDLGDWLDLDVTQGTGNATGGSCADFSPLGSGASVYSGTVSGFTATGFSNGYGNWAPAAGNASRTFMFTYEVNSSAPDSTQGGTAGLTFVWEAQS